MIRVKYSDQPRRDILCVDVKSFFASVEAVERNLHPLKAYIAVMSRGNQQGGLVLAASPRVKEEFGIKTGSRKYEIPPNSPIQLVKPQMGLYLKKNADIINIFRQYVSEDDLHIYSIDESFLDVTASHRLFGNTFDIARKIQEQIWKELRLLVTIGIGDNPLLAKLALDNDAKHNRQKGYIVRWTYESVPETVWKIDPITDMWGIGKRTQKKLHQLGIDSVYELSQYDVNRLKKMYGIIGEQLFYHAHGIDQSIISEKYQPVASSFSRSQILEYDYTQLDQIKIIIKEMTDLIGARLREHRTQAGLVHLTVGYSRHILSKGFSRQKSIDPTNESHKLIQAALDLLDEFYDGLPVRMIGISCGKLQAQHNIQLDLFEQAQDTLHRLQLEKTVDQVRSRYGYSSLVQASSLLDGATAIDRSHLIGGHRG